MKYSTMVPSIDFQDYCSFLGDDKGPFKYDCVCYDVMRCWKMFDIPTPGILQDVKILYELRGLKFSNLIELSEYVMGKDETLKFRELDQRLNAHVTSYKICGIDIKKYRENMLFPENLLESYYYEKCVLLDRLFEEHVKQNEPELEQFYQKFYRQARTLYKIGCEPIDIDLKFLEDKVDHNIRTIQLNTKKNKAYLKFHPVGAKTGRLAFEKKSINIYGLPRELRGCILAPKDMNLVEFDLKSAQPRLAIFDTSDEEFKNKFRNVEDIYSIFPGDREKNKKDFLTWMYFNNKNELFEREAYPILQQKNELFRQAKNNCKVVNRFGRVLYYNDEEKHVVYQNYVTSLEVDSMLKILSEVYDAGFRILFPFHDSLVCAVDEKESYCIDEIKSIMQNVLYEEFKAKFPIKVKMGKNYGDMK